MVKYALSKNSQLKFNPGATKTKKDHLECALPLQEVKGGLWYCPACFKTGYLVKVGK